MLKVPSNFLLVQKMNSDHQCTLGMVKNPNSTSCLMITDLGALSIRRKILWKQLKTRWIIDRQTGKIELKCVWMSL